MQVKRFDFTSLQDFREPLKVPEVIANDNDFGPIEIVPPPPPPPTFSEDELEAVRQRAYEDGRQAGLQEGHEIADTETAQRDKLIQTLLGHIVTHAGEIETRHHEFMRLQSGEILQLVLMIARQVAGKAVEAIPQAGVEAMIDGCLNILMHQPKVLLSVNPAMEQVVSGYLHLFMQQRGVECDTRVVADHSLMPGDGRLEWKDGMAERRQSEIWKQIETMLQTIDFTTLADSVSSQAKTDETIPEGE